MAPFVLLLRGINVGRNKRLAMADLRDLLTDLGYDDVRTHLNSGNAVFVGPAGKPAAVAATIQAAISDRLGMSVPSLVLTAAELAAVVRGNPFPERVTDGAKLMAHLLFATPTAAARKAFDPVTLDPDNIRVGERVVYQWCAGGLLDAPAVGPAVIKHWGTDVTARNWNTMATLAKLTR